MTIRLLANVANDPIGAVLEVDEDRAKRLTRMGYAEYVKPKLRDKAKDKES